MSSQFEPLKKGEKKMKFRNKIFSTIVLALTLMIPAAMASMQIATAHTPPLNVPTDAFLNVAPNPIGVGQTATLTFWLNTPPPTANGNYGDRWQGFTITVTKPDGTTQTLGPYKSDPVGSGYAFYTPDQTGNYVFQFNFPGQLLSGANPPPVPNSYSLSAFVNDTFLPSSSPKLTVVVQQQAVQQYPSAQLPTDYWQRPINANNREWFAIGGNWLLSGYDSTGQSYNPFTTGPDSAHILWTKPLAFGGILGGSFGGGGTSSYYNGLSYETKFPNPVIIQGQLYYNQYPTTRYANMDVYPLGYNCVDLRTGKTIFTANTTVTFGQILDWVSPNQYGGVAYLWGYNGASNGVTSTWYCSDAFSGNLLFRMTNVPSGTMTMDNQGDILIYTLNNAGGWLSMWNSSLAVSNYWTTLFNNGTITQANYYYNWRPPTGSVVDARVGIQWNVTVTKYSLPSAQSISKIDYADGVLLATTGGSNAQNPGYEMEIGYSTTTGQQLWVQNRTLPVGMDMFGIMGAASSGVYTEYIENTMQWYCYSILTGNLIWGPSVPYSLAWGFYQQGSVIAYGCLYTSAWDGTIHCYNITNGKNLWNTYTGSSGFETAYGDYPLAMGFAVADGKVYASQGHTHLQPLFRNASVVCVDAYSGNLLWSSLGWIQGPVIADGILVGFNNYDGQLYAFGKGRTATTVSTQTFAAPQGTPVLLQGTVTDQSPGQTCLGVPAAGTPAISDANMTAWMAYLYEQQPKPANAVGVKVHLTAVDPNNNFQDIGYVTSDATGNYKMQWTPPVPGVYTITATFAGSNSYYSSTAETGLIVSQATPAPNIVITAAPATATPAPANTPAPSSVVTVAPTPSPVVVPPTSAVPTTTYVAIGVAVILVVAVAAALIIRRRK